MAFAGTARYFTACEDITSTSTGSSADVIYTCPANFVSLIRFLHISNGDAQKKVAIQWYDKSADAYHYIVHDFNQDANSLTEVIQGGGYIALEAGDKIVAYQESSDADFHIMLSGEEHYQPT